MSTDMIAVNAAQTRRERSDARANNRAQTRHKATKDNDHILTQLDPPLHGDTFTTGQVADYLQCSRSALLALSRGHWTELTKVGFKAGNHGAGNQGTYTRRAVLHAALIMRQGQPRADAIKQALGMWVGDTPAQRNDPQMAHAQECRHAITKALAVAEVVQDMDAADAWEELAGMTRYELQRLTVALAAMVPIDRGQRELRYYLTKIGRMVLAAKGRADRDDASASGLASLVPPRLTVVHQ